MIFGFEDGIDKFQFSINNGLSFVSNPFDNYLQVQDVDEELFIGQEVMGKVGSPYEGQTLFINMFTDVTFTNDDVSNSYDLGLA